MTGSLALPSLELLFRMSPLAAIQSFIFGLIAGEIPVFWTTMKERTDNLAFWGTLLTVTLLLGNGLLAFVLNVSSFQTNKIAGALTVTVAGNLKQACTLALGILVFGDFSINILNGLGIAMVVIGCGWFSKVELDNKRNRK